MKGDENQCLHLFAASQVALLLFQGKLETLFPHNFEASIGNATLSAYH